MIRVDGQAAHPASSFGARRGQQLPITPRHRRAEPERCTGCRLCEDSCGWGAIYIDPPRELLKKRAWPGEEEDAERLKLAPVG